LLTNILNYENKHQRSIFVLNRENMSFVSQASNSEHF
jgi:hypothetical protein